jgi:hypothetical protein
MKRCSSLFGRFFVVGLITCFPGYLGATEPKQPIQAAASPQDPHADSDTRLRTLLRGEWVEHFDDPTLTIIEFKEDGTFSSCTWDGPARTKKIVTFTGNWKVEGGFIVYETKFCSDPAIDISQSIIRDRIAEASERTIIYEASDGSRHTFTRLPTPAARPSA